MAKENAAPNAPAAPAAAGAPAAPAAPNAPAAPAAAGTPAAPAAAGAPAATGAPAAPAAPKTYTEAEMAAMLAKARSEEKDKLYPRLDAQAKAIEDARKASEEASAQMAAIAKERADAKKLEEDAAKAEADAKLTADERMQQRLLELTTAQAAADTRAEALQAQLEKVTTESVERLRLAELRTYREKKIAASGVQLTELVTGNTQEEIDASIVTAAAREKVLSDKVAAETEKRVRESLGKTVPKPAAPGASPGAQPSMTSALDRQRLARLPPEEYEKVRAQMMEQARTG